MKKYIIYLFSALLLTFSFVSCEEELEIWESSTAPLDGNWELRYDHSYYGIDPFGAGRMEHITFNTAENDGDSIWLDDKGNFWPYKVKVPCNINNLTFGTEDTLISVYDGIQVLIRNGVIVKNAITLPSKTVADSIYYEVWFEDLQGSTGIAGDTLFVSGYRMSGFAEDILP
jgi:Lipid-binding putative hydrolase